MLLGRPKGTRYAVGVGMAYVIFGMIALAGALQHDHVAGLVIGGGIFALCAPFIWRSGLYVTRDGLTCVPVSGKQTTYSWADIKEFKVARSNESSGFAIHATLIDDRDVQLPATGGWSPMRPKMERVCTKLAEAKARADAVHPTTPRHSLITDLETERAEVVKQRRQLALLCPLGLACGVWAMLEGVGPLALIGFGGAPLLVLLPTQLQLRIINRRLARAQHEPGPPV